MKSTNKKILATLVLTFSFFELLAQGVPGGCNDADDCEAVPLDNWLMVLFATGLIFTTWYLHNKQKREAIA